MNIQIQEAINHMVESFCPKGTKDKVFKTTLSCRYDNFDKDRSSVKLIHFVFDCSSNYIKVGYVIGGSKTFSRVIEEGSIFNYAGNHDSCWRGWHNIVLTDLANHLLKDGIDMCNDWEYISYSNFHKTVLIDGKLVPIEREGRHFFIFSLEKSF